MTKRFRVVNETLSGHRCCFRHSVIDITSTEHDQMFCETYKQEDAELIAAALNAYTQKDLVLAALQEVVKSALEATDGQPGIVEMSNALEVIERATGGQP